MKHYLKNFFSKSYKHEFQKFIVYIDNTNTNQKPSGSGTTDTVTETGSGNNTGLIVVGEDTEQENPVSITNDPEKDEISSTVKNTVKSSVISDYLHSKNSNLLSKNPLWSALDPQKSFFEKSIEKANILYNVQEKLYVTNIKQLPEDIDLNKAKDNDIFINYYNTLVNVSIANTMLNDLFYNLTDTMDKQHLQMQAAWENIIAKIKEIGIKINADQESLNKQADVLQEIKDMNSNIKILSTLENINYILDNKCSPEFINYTNYYESTLIERDVYFNNLMTPVKIKYHKLTGETYNDTYNIQADKNNFLLTTSNSSTQSGGNPTTESSTDDVGGEANIVSVMNDDTSEENNDIYDRYVNILVNVNDIMKVIESLPGKDEKKQETMDETLSNVNLETLRYILLYLKNDHEIMMNNLDDNDVENDKLNLYASKINSLSKSTGDLELTPTTWDGTLDTSDGIAYYIERAVNNSIERHGPFDPDHIESQGKEFIHALESASNIFSKFKNSGRNKYKKSTVNQPDTLSDGSGIYKERGREKESRKLISQLAAEKAKIRQKRRELERKRKKGVVSDDTGSGVSGSSDTSSLSAKDTGGLSSTTSKKSGPTGAKSGPTGAKSSGTTDKTGSMTSTKDMASPDTSNIPIASSADISNEIAQLKKGLNDDNNFKKPTEKSITDFKKNISKDEKINFNDYSSDANTIEPNAKIDNVESLKSALGGGFKVVDSKPEALFNSPEDIMSAMQNANPDNAKEAISAITCLADQISNIPLKDETIKNELIKMVDGYPPKTISGLTTRYYLHQMGVPLKSIKTILKTSINNKYEQDTAVQDTTTGNPENEQSKEQETPVASTEQQTDTPTETASSPTETLSPTETGQPETGQQETEQQTEEQQAELGETDETSATEKATSATEETSATEKATSATETPETEQQQSEEQQSVEQQSVEQQSVEQQQAEQQQAELGATEETAVTEKATSAPESPSSATEPAAPAAPA